MPPRTPLRSDLAKLFRDHLLEWSKQAELSVAGAALPLTSTKDIRFRATDEPLIKAKRGRKVTQSLTSWPAVGLHAKPNPTLVCLLDGMADISIGVTDVMARNANVCSARGVYHARLKEKCILIYPSNVPICDGTKPHWDEDGQPQPDCSILWIDVIAEGAMLHTCHSVRSQHILGESRFVINTRLLPLVETAIDEIQEQTGSKRTANVSADIVSAVMRVLLLNIYRSLLDQRSHGDIQNDDGVIDMISEMALDGKPERATSSTYTVKRCCEYIQGHLGHPLNVEKIANFAFVSPAQLNRFFRAELNQSVMEYVNDQRLGQAKRLLVSTNLPINFISENLGFLEPAYFSRFFRLRTGLTPGKFRKLHR